MGKVHIHAGSWSSGSAHSFDFDAFKLLPLGAWFSHEKVRTERLIRLEIADEANVKRVGSAAGWGALGALAFGPAGLVAGVILGGNGKDVTFVAEFDDGRTMLATTDAKTFVDIKSSMFRDEQMAAVKGSVSAHRVEMAAKARREEADKGFYSEYQLDNFAKLIADGRFEEAYSSLSKASEENRKIQFEQDGEALDHLTSEELDELERLMCEQDRGIDRDREIDALFKLGRDRFLDRGN